jgi:hypothetical protein
MHQDRQHLLVGRALSAGIQNNEMIFKHDGLAKLLELGERVEEDGGYQGGVPELVKCPGVAEEEPNKIEMQQR